MGGRGARSGGKYKLPNYQNVVIRRNKLKNYLLNPNKSKGKADFFRSIGYNMKNWKLLESDIRKGLKNNSAIARIQNKYGNAVSVYSVDMPLGVNKKAIVVTGWQIDAGTKVPRFITAYPGKEK